MLATAITEVRKALSGRAEYDQCESISLRMHRFVRIPETGKNDELDAVCACATAHRGKATPFAFADSTFDLTLQSRLMVNHSGGVIENTGLCLHRHINCPMIPGSAAKGVARHYAWEQWRHAHDVGQSAEARRIAADIAAVFGYPTGDKNLDEYIKREALCGLDAKGQRRANAGSVAFLPALPVDDQWQLVTDVQTPHGGNDYTNPVPSFFLAVEEGCAFRFALKATSRAKDNHLALAEVWLKAALQQNGIGAKTAAGYGWFEFDAEADARQREAARLEAEATAREKARAEAEATRLAALTPEQRAAETFLKTLPAADTLGVLKGKMSGIATLPEFEQRAICILLRDIPAYRVLWINDLKDARKKDKAKARVEAVRAIAMNLGVELP